MSAEKCRCNGTGVIVKTGIQRGTMIVEQLPCYKCAARNFVTPHRPNTEDGHYSSVTDPTETDDPYELPEEWIDVDE